MYLFQGKLDQFIHPTEACGRAFTHGRGLAGPEVPAPSQPGLVGMRAIVTSYSSLFIQKGPEQNFRMLISLKL